MGNDLRGPVQGATIRGLAVAGLGIIAVALAGAAIEDPRSERPPGEGEGAAGGGGGMPLPDPVESPTVPFLPELLFGLFGLFLIVGLVYLLYSYREAAPMLLAIVAMAVIVALFLRFASFDFPEGMMRAPPENATSLPGTGGGDRTDPEGEVQWLPIALVLGAFWLVVLAAAAVTLGGRHRGTSLGTAEEPDPSGEKGRRVRQDLGAAAERAADRIVATDGYENEIYRAWDEMTNLLDVSSPRTATPGDFARQAIAQGMHPADVRDLTRLFEEVRYGDRPPTSEREAEAVTLLRRIAERYGEGD